MYRLNLEKFFEEYKSVALAFSGGVDSAYLLYMAIKAKIRVRAYYVKSDFQPDFELKDAKRLSKELGADMKIIEMDVLENADIARNPKDRCYYCKHEIFGTILKVAKEDGFKVLIDGTNASDSEADRPGMKAKSELKVLSPLRMAGLSKHDIRELSKEAGLFTWDKPSYSCLATRMEIDKKIDRDDLKRTESAEDFMRDLGFSDFRIRNLNKGAKIQLRDGDFQRFFSKRAQIYKRLIRDYEFVVLDLEVRS
ncbi:ATP-dependent sacrificial sulfur transferase LarE [Peptoniphilus sp. GNH]|nr:TIGR00268 family protein [Clostridiales bacterium KA00134]UHR03426.1 ATP-dependent sacrificial sulfur transferase LarE [Peptoniphilus sp. GNH]